MTIESLESNSLQKSVDSFSRQDDRPFFRDLHDIIGSVLSALLLKCELACKLVLTEPDRTAAELREIAGIAEQAESELREIAANRHRARLVDAIALIQSALTAAGVTLTIVGADTALPPAVERAFAAVLRESTTNLLCHSAATDCRVKVESAASAASISIVNNFSMASPLRTHRETLRTVRSATSSSGGLGLASLSLRVMELGGTFSSSREPDGGYAVRAAIPLDQPAAAVTAEGRQWPETLPEGCQDKRRWEFASRNLASVVGDSLSIAQYCVTHPDQAQAGLADLAETVRRVLADIRAMITEVPQARESEHESSSVQAVLASADISSTVSIDADLPGPVHSVMIMILREGVVNVLRHEGVKHCEVSLRQTDSEVRLDILNDGVYPHAQPWFRPSTETRQLFGRLRALGGTLTTLRRADGSVALHVRVGATAARRGVVATASLPRELS